MYKKSCWAHHTIDALDILIMYPIKNKNIIMFISTILFFSPIHASTFDPNEKQIYKERKCKLKAKNKAYKASFEFYQFIVGYRI